jgi:hypothetical protein
VKLHPFFADYTEKIRALDDPIRAVITDLPEKALDWYPLPGINSLAVLAVHSALYLGHMQITRQMWEARDDSA